MAVHHCPKCELGFALKPTLEYHLRNDHPDTHFDYPADHPVNEDWPMAQEPKRYSWRPTHPVRHSP